MTLTSRVKGMARRILRLVLQDVVNDIRLSAPLVFGPRDRLKLHATATVQNALFNVVSGTISIEEHVFFGHNVSLLTGSHDITKFDQERQNRVPPMCNDILVKRGAWIASNALIIGPCVIGEHAVVAAGSVVIRDVPPLSVVAGNPAKVVKTIPAPQ